MMGILPDKIQELSDLDQAMAWGVAAVILAIVGVMLLISSPLWIIPYIIIKVRK